MITTPDYTAIIAQCARIAIRNEETHGTDPAHQFIAALHGTLQGTLNAGIGDAGTRAAFQALDALFQRLQSVTE